MIINCIVALKCFHLFSANVSQCSKDPFQESETAGLISLSRRRFVVKLLWVVRGCRLLFEIGRSLLILFLKTKLKVPEKFFFFFNRYNRSQHQRNMMNDGS